MFSDFWQKGFWWATCNVTSHVLIYTHVGGYGFESCCARAIFVVGFWFFGAQVAARAKMRVERDRTGGSCAFRGWPRVHFPTPIFFDARFAVYDARRRLLGSKTRISTTLHRQGPRMVPEASNARFGSTGARNRSIPTLLTSETCAQTPLDRPSQNAHAPRPKFRRRA